MVDTWGLRCKPITDLGKSRILMCQHCYVINENVLEANKHELPGTCHGFASAQAELAQYVVICTCTIEWTWMSIKEQFYMNRRAYYSQTVFNIPVDL